MNAHMKMLEQLVHEKQAVTRMAKVADIEALQSALGFPLSAEYREYLSCFGLISYGGYETYGLGIPEGYYLNVMTAYKDLACDSSYPVNAVPLIELGDGQYYLYDNQTQKVLLWATPNGGLVRALNESLESFLVKHIFEG